MNNFFDFLKELRSNNNREWFAEHKKEFEAAKSQADEIFEAIYAELSTIEKLQPLKKYRIYRDIRFSKDKTPYKNHFSAYVGRNQPAERGGFYIHFENDNCFVGGGFWAPEKEDLLRIRQSIEFSDELEEILNEPKLVQTFGELFGKELKTAPKGFSKEHERIHLLRKKQFLLVKKYKNSDVLLTDFPAKVVQDYQTLLPFYHYMSEVLTTNANGESIL